MGFLGEFISAIRVLQCSFRMPLSCLVVSFFIVFGGSPMGAGCKFVLLGGFPMYVVHGCFSPPLLLHEAYQSVIVSDTALDGSQWKIWQATCTKQRT